MASLNFVETNDFDSQLPTPLVPDDTLIGPALVDIDGDGDLDLFLGSNRGNITYHENTGSASVPNFNTTARTNVFGLQLPNAPQPAGQDSRAKPTFADIDGDGDFDAFVGEYTGDIYFFRNDGTANAPSFSNQGTNLFGIGAPDPTTFYVAPTLVDIDGDGDLDLFVGRYTKTGGNATEGNILFYENEDPTPTDRTDGDPVFTRNDADNPFNSVTITAKNEVAVSFILNSDLVDGGSNVYDAVIGVFLQDQQQGDLRYFKNTGTATNPVLVEQTGTADPFGDVSAIRNPVPSFVDFNGDGLSDLLVGAGPGTGLTAFENQVAPEAVAGDFLNADTATNIFTVGRQGGSNLQLKLTGESANKITQVKLKFLDANKAVTEAYDLFSVLPSLFRPNGFTVGLEGFIFDSVDAGERFVIELQTIDGQTIGFGTNNLRVTNLGTGQWQLAFEEGDDSSFDDLILSIQQTTSGPPAGVGSNQREGLEVIDLSGVAGGQASFTVYREAAFNNFVGFYRIDDASGSIGGLAPGQAGYARAAIENRVGGIELSVANQSISQFSASLSGNALYAPFIIADGDVFSFLKDNPDNLGGGASTAYFVFAAANPDGVDHIRLLGDNIFGFEDLPGGGDFDYNDIILNISLAA